MPESICFTAHKNLSRGARYFRCAFQVNPPHYAKTYRGTEHCLTEDEYIDQLVAKCIEHEISVIAVTDHNHVGTIDKIRTKCEEKGIAVFPGFEISSSEGVHALCLYPPDTTVEALGRFLARIIHLN